MQDFTNVCIGTTSTLSDPDGAGTWASTLPGIATVDAAGVVTGVAAGTTSIVFTLGTTGCSISTNVTVTNTFSPITGALSFCQYSTSLLNNPTGGGNWVVSNTVNATIDAVTGLASGLEAGMDTVTYSIGTCTASAVITINPVPVPGAITGNSTVCIGSTTALADTPAGGAWVSASPLIASVDALGNVTGVAVGTADIVYNVTNACGTTGVTFLMTVVTGVKSINGLPNVCVGSDIGLIDSSVGGIWSESNANASIAVIGGTLCVVTGVTAGGVIISYSLTNSCGTTVATFLETVGNPAPTGIVAGPAEICVGTTDTFTETVTGGYWSSGASGSVSVNSIGAVTGIAQGGDTVYYNIMATCGLCRSWQYVHVDSFGAPFVSISANPGFTTCESIPVTYTATPTFGGTAPTYVWKVNGIFMGVGDSLVYAPADSDLVTCVMTTNYPCATVPTASNFIFAHVIPLVVPTVKTIAGTLGDTVCVGTLDTFYATYTNGGLAPVFNWAVNGTYVFTGANFYYTPNSFDVITCTLLSNATCAIPDSVKSSIAMTVDVLEVPKVTVSINPNDSVCPGTLVTYTAHGIYGGRNPVYHWIKNGVVVATGQSYSYYPSNLDTISCEFTSNAPCASPANVYSSKILMHIVPVIPPTIALSASPSTVVPYGHSITLTASVTGGGPAPTYQWIVNGFLVAGATTSTYVVSYVNETKNVSCLVTGSGDCPAAENTNSIVVGFVPSSVAEVENTTSQFVVSPNPNKGGFVLHGNNAYKNTYGIEIANVVGQLVYTGTTVATNGIIDKQISLENLPNGVYLLKVSAGEETKVIRFVIEQ